MSSTFTQFEWNPDKAARNLSRHRISFETAVRAFADPLALSAQDRVENGERRWQTLGTVEGYLLLLVAHTLRDAAYGSEVIRIISARRADPKERRRYEQQNR